MSVKCEVDNIMSDIEFGNHEQVTSSEVRTVITEKPIKNRMKLTSMGRAWL